MKNMLGLNKKQQSSVPLVVHQVVTLQDSQLSEKNKKQGNEEQQKHGETKMSVKNVDNDLLRRTALSRLRLKDEMLFQMKRTDFTIRRSAGLGCRDHMERATVIVLLNVT